MSYATVKYDDKGNYYIIDTGAEEHVLTRAQTYTLVAWCSTDIPVADALQKARQIPGQPVQL